MSAGRPRAARPLAVYVHFPWCLRKCPYCDFASIQSEREAIPHHRYAEAVLAELERRADWIGPRRLTSVYFGGGTPSLWDPAALGRILEAVRKRWPSADTPPEVTVECNPSSFDAATARALAAAGISRVSLGVQSLDDRRLERLGRLHDASRAIASIEEAIAGGVPNVSADLLFGIAGQDPDAAAEEAARIASLGVSHISAYSLTIEPGTPFGRLAREGRLPLLGEDGVADSFLAIGRVLGAAGFDHYEISSYARNGRTARHNLVYWRGEDYLGLGAAAWGTITSSDARLRYRNTSDAGRYTDASLDLWPSQDLHTAGGLVQHVEHIDAETALRERIMLGLRLRDGIDVAEQARQLGVEPWPPKRRRAAERLVAVGRLAEAGSRLYVPEDAWLLADGTISELM